MPTHSSSPDHSAYDQSVRQELSAFLRGGQAHASLDAAVKNMPDSLLDKKPAGSPHNAWQMLEHIRIAQHDLLEFCTNPNYQSLKWPDEYWPKDESPKSSSPVLRRAQSQSPIGSSEQKRRIRSALRAICIWRRFPSFSSLRK